VPEVILNRGLVDSERSGASRLLTACAPNAPSTTAAASAARPQRQAHTDERSSFNRLTDQATALDGSADARVRLPRHGPTGCDRRPLLHSTPAFGYLTRTSLEYEVPPEDAVGLTAVSSSPAIL